MVEAIELKVTCKFCGKTYFIPVFKEEYEAWQKGAHVQDAFPDMSIDNRELLISGMCGKCFDELFDED